MGREAEERAQKTEKLTRSKKNVSDRRSKEQKKLEVTATGRIAVTGETAVTDKTAATGGKPLQTFENATVDRDTAYSRSPFLAYRGSRNIAYTLFLLHFSRPRSF